MNKRQKMVLVIGCTLGLILFEKEIFELLIGAWKLNSNNNKDASFFIVPLNYGMLAHNKELSFLNLKVINEAREIAETLPHATVLIGAFTYSPDPEWEAAEKVRLLKGYTIRSIGPVESTVKEAVRTRKVLGFEPPSILIVAGETHSRSVKLVWEHYFPHSKILIHTVPYWAETEPDACMLFAQGKWVWLLANTSRHAVLLLPFDWGFWMFEQLNIHQPSV